MLTTSFPRISLPPPHITITTTHKKSVRIICCANSDSTPSLSTTVRSIAPPVSKKRKRYRKLYPGEIQGITEEMRFVAMRLRNVGGKYTHKSPKPKNDAVKDAETWEPSIEGFVKYLVDSKLVFETVERIVDKSDDVSYAYFRKSGLERAEGLEMDLEWIREREIDVPEASDPGLTYAKYLEELAGTSAPLFLAHYYNIYFSHIAGGQVIARQVSEKLFEGREMEFYKWEGDVEEFLKDVRSKLNMLGEHWSRDDKNKCLKEAAKSFKSMGQIVRLIIL